MTGAGVHLFAGPSLPAEQARRLLPGVTVHGPVRHLSLLELSLRPGDTVAIVDGLFHQTAPIRHKELLHVMGVGVHVWGAGSMGALRAAELDSLGMRGVGIVYRLFAVGALDRDDEVAVVHGRAEDGYRQASDALVSIRVAARRSRRRGLIDRDVERALVTVAAVLPYPERRYETVARLAGEAGADRRQCTAFLRMAPAAGIDVKRQDAELLLRRIAASPPAAARPSPQPRKTPLTLHLARWIDMVRGDEIEGERVTDLAALAVCQAFARDYPAFHEELVLRAIDAAASTERPRAERRELEAAALSAGLARGLLLAPEPRPNPALHTWVSEEEQRSPRQASLRVLVRSYREPGGMAADQLALEALRGTDLFALAQRYAAQAQRLDRLLADRDPWQRSDRIPESRVRAWFADRWGAPSSPDLFELAAQDRGFVSNSELARRTRFLLPYAISKGIPEVPLPRQVA